jgi:hypothetical protein
MSYAEVTECSGKFYITPLRARLNGVSYATKDEAQYISDAVNLAYKAGRADLQRDLRDLFGAAMGQDSED